MAAPSEVEVEKQPLFAVKFNNAPHYLKFRDSFAIGDRCRAEIGWDHHLNADRLHRVWGSLVFQLEDKKGGAQLEINNDYVTLNKRLELKMKKLSVGVDAKVGMTTAGKPHVSIGLDNIPLVLTAAVVMLALKQPIHVSRKETGGLSLDLQLCRSGASHYALQERAELDCTLRRKKGLAMELDFHELSGVIRLRQDRTKPKAS